MSNAATTLDPIPRVRYWAVHWAMNKFALYIALNANFVPVHVKIHDEDMLH